MERPRGRFIEWRVIYLVERDLRKVCGGEDNYRWFDSLVRCEVGEGDKINFWKDPWLSGVSLATSHVRLFLNSKQKEESVNRTGRWEDDMWIWDFCWRRRWFVWKVDIVENINHLLANVKLLKKGRDAWRWKLSQMV